MNRPEQLPELSSEQWAFLAVLETFNRPVSIELVGHLAPLLPGPLFDLLEKTQPVWVDNKTWRQPLFHRKRIASRGSNSPSRH